MNKISALQFLAVLSVILSVFINFQAHTIYGGDAGDLVSAMLTHGIPHPPGYPLYTALGILVLDIANYGTPAYKSAFLSSVPSALSIAFLFLLLRKLSRTTFESLIAALLTGFLYPVFLYSVVPEVFSLNNLFTVLLIFTFFKFNSSGNFKFLLLGAYLFSLSVTHHHTVIFLLPSLIYISYHRLVKINIKYLLRIMIVIVAGLVPYIYVFISAGKSPAINWMGIATPANFLSLFFRTSYGTFTAGGFINPSIVSRFLNVFAFFEFLNRDFTVMGIAIIILGLLRIYRKDRVIWRFVSTSLISYLFLLFYASFPLRENFMLATFERYIITPYIILAIPFCFGLSEFKEIAGKILGKLTSPNKRLTYEAVTLTILCFLPLFILMKNTRKISIIKYDFTAENFARDLFQSTNGRGVLLLAADTPLFNSQYVYYSSKGYGNIIPLHFAKLAIQDNVIQLKRRYPDAGFKKALNGEYMIDDLLKDLEDNDIYSIQSYNLENGRWVPWGLVYRYYSATASVDYNEVIAVNEILWEKYNDPLDGSLTHFENFFLSDVLKWYAEGRLETAFFEAKNGRMDLAAKHIAEAKKLNGNDPNSYIISAQIKIKTGVCDEAEREIAALAETNPKENIANYLSYLNYQRCFKNDSRASEYLSVFEKNQKQKETPLKML